MSRVAIEIVRCELCHDEARQEVGADGLPEGWSLHSLNRFSVEDEELCPSCAEAMQSAREARMKLRRDEA